MKREVRSKCGQIWMQMEIESKSYVTICSTTMFCTLFHKNIVRMRERILVLFINADVVFCFVKSDHNMDNTVLILISKVIQNFYNFQFPICCDENKK